MVAGIHIFQDPSSWFVFRVKKRREGVSRGRLGNRKINMCDQRGKIGVRMQRLRTEGSLKTGHHECRADSLPRYVADGNPPAPTLQRNKIVVVTAQAASGQVEGFGAQTRDGEAAGRQK